MTSEYFHSMKLPIVFGVAFSLVWLGQLSLCPGETLLEYHRGSDQPSQPIAVPTLKIDTNVAPASGEQVRQTTPPPKVDHRRLAPQSQTLGAANSQVPNKRKPVSFGMPKIESLTTAATGLAIVIGLFMICMWLLKGSGPKPTSPLPGEAVSVLGRVPLAQRNYAQLLQVGNKLVLVSVTPDGVAPITEVTDPSEVTRLLGICLRNRKQSSSTEFHHVLEQLAQEPAQGFLGNEASTAYARSR